MKSLLTIYILFNTSWAQPQVNYMDFPTYETCTAYQNAIVGDLKIQIKKGTVKDFTTSCTAVWFPSAKVDDK